MIDYLKILISDTELAKDLYNKPLLQNHSNHRLFKALKNNISNEIGDIKQATYTKEYKEILFCFFSKKDAFTKLEIFIKPHYYYNNNLHNANDFTAKDCINVLKGIRDTFNLPAKKLIILNMEFGINAISPIDVKDLINHTLYHDKNEFINSSDHLRFSKISFKYNRGGKANNYKMIKFYAKGVQFPDFCDPDTFRFEVKSKRRNFINKLKISTYEDLLQAETYQILAKEILIEWRKVLILDMGNKMPNLTDKESNKLKDLLHPSNWYSAIQGSKNTFNNRKKNYFRLLDKTECNIHRTIDQIIEDKLKFLLKDCAILTPPLELKSCAILNTNIIEIGTNYQRERCPVTGLPLSHEKDGAIYIKTSTLKHLRDHDQDKFIEICSLLLNKSHGKRPKYEQGIISHLAKQVRNRYYNQFAIKQSGYHQKKYSNQLDIFN